MEAYEAQLIKESLTKIAKEKDIPIERLITGIMQGELYVWDYDSGRAYSDQFRVVATIKLNS